MPPPTIEVDESLLVISFGGSARVKKKCGAYTAIVWKLPEWTIVAAASEFAMDLTVNEAEYRGLLLGFDLLVDQTSERVIICGDSNLVIKQMRGEIDCKAPGLKLLRHKAMEKLRLWPAPDFLYMKRDWNQSTDRLASEALYHEKGSSIVTDRQRQNLITLSRLGELLVPKKVGRAIRVTAITRSDKRRRCRPQILQEEIVRK